MYVYMAEMKANSIFIENVIIVFDIGEVVLQKYIYLEFDLYMSNCEISMDHPYNAYMLMKLYTCMQSNCLRACIKTSIT